jgi:hypothetical protein
MEECPIAVLLDSNRKLGSAFSELLDFCQDDNLFELVDFLSHVVAFSGLDRLGSLEHSSVAIKHESCGTLKCFLENYLECSLRCHLSGKRVGVRAELV